MNSNCCSKLLANQLDFSQSSVEPAKCGPNNHNKPNTKAFSNGSYPFTRKLYVIINRNDENKRKAGEAYANLLLTTQGQQLIEDAGFSGIPK